jgi:hypothetical protein
MSLTTSTRGLNPFVVVLRRDSGIRHCAVLLLRDGSPCSTILDHHGVVSAAMGPKPLGRQSGVGCRRASGLFSYRSFAPAEAGLPSDLPGLGKAMHQIAPDADQGGRAQEDTFV